jgi:hypothetical protein
MTRLPPEATASIRKVRRSRPSIESLHRDAS